MARPSACARVACCGCGCGRSSGAMAMSRSAPAMTLANTGAATSPAVVLARRRLIDARRPPRAAAALPARGLQRPTCTCRSNNRRQFAFHAVPVLPDNAVAGERSAYPRAVWRDHRLQHAPPDRAPRARSSTRLPGTGLDRLRRNVTGRSMPPRAERGVGMRELQRRDRQAVAVRQRGDADAAPVRMMARAARRIRRDSRCVLTWPNPSASSVLQICSGSSVQRDLRHADVAGLGEDRGQVDHAQVVLVLDHLDADLQNPGARIDDAAPVVLPGGERRRNDERLDARARLEDVGGGAIAVASRLRAARDRWD